MEVASTEKENRVHQTKTDKGGFRLQFSGQE